MLKFFNNERGSTVTILFLILLPLAVLFLIASLDHTRVVFGTDLDMQQALNDACRSATMMVSPLSQAYNNPMIDPDKAHMAFRDILASNLKLNDDLTPRENSPVTDVEYLLVVFNGVNSYEIPAGKAYSETNPAGTEFSGTLPYIFTEAELGENIRVELDTPGCIAIATANLKPILGQQESMGIRWSSAKILN